MGSREIIISSRAADRIAHAQIWIEQFDSASEILIVAASQEAAESLVRRIAIQRGAVFGLHRLPFNRLAGLLAAEQAAMQGVAYINGLAIQAIAARTLFTLKGDSRLEPLRLVIDLPGLPRAIATTHAELRHAGVSAESLAAFGDIGAALAVIFGEFDEQLAAARALDRAGILRTAIAAISNTPPPPYATMPIVMLDCPLDNRLERDLVAALANRAPVVLATAPHGDYRTINFLAAALEVEPKALDENSDGQLPSLRRVQQYLFAETTPGEAQLDDTVALESAAGEMQECVEIVRRIQAEARRGVAFDQIAVLLHSPTQYVPYLEEAFERAGVEGWFARGTRRPEPGGRALLALLNCAAERFSARRFAEYLSLAQVPEQLASATQVAATSREFVPSDPEFLQAGLDPLGLMPLDSAETDPTPQPAGGTRAPWRWERLLIDAGVVGGRERWESRLHGLEAELQLRRDELDDDDSRLEMTKLELGHLADMRAIALPIIDELAALPEATDWNEWLIHLRALTELAVRDRGAVLAALAELEPMGPIGGITLDEVRIVLGERLGRLERPHAKSRYGAVFVGSTAQARGLDFAVTIVPGLAERVLPKKLTEDPLLADTIRRQLDADLSVQSDRVEAERLALRIAAGSANTRVRFSYPRIDLDQGRPRVPSFYALEVLRAAEGRLPGFDELARRAAGEYRGRLGWPAPKATSDAIDDAEFDLAVLDRVVGSDAEDTTGAAHYLLDANDHLGRALRARARRWLRRWTPNDGLIDPTEQERAALARHQLEARSFSPTALQNYAACPYRFYLQAIIRLEPREAIEAIEAIDPLTRGALFHEVQFATLTMLRDSDLLPVRHGNLGEAYRLLEHQLVEGARKYHERLAPAIERVWLDGIESIRADLREWMRRMADDPAGFEPQHFELSFGLSDREQADPSSVPDPIALDAGIQLRGSIDLVERGPEGLLRATDHKTGRVRAERNFVIGGGKTLQPALYALAAEQILDQKAGTGRLYYCTAAGGYEERIVPLDLGTRKAVEEFAGIIRSALKEGFMPAAPDERECEYCDYRLVCGPYEQMRFRMKSETSGAKARLADLTRLRAMR